ncbi:MAG: hypothetical protein JJ975_16635 [Bacteroidia bacterium]|nr:hypothetical protein [Bacteroidia bacterium]
MKQILLFLSLILTGAMVKADQHQVMSIETAQKAIELLNQQKFVIEWCACCDGTTAKRYEIASIETVPWGGNLVTLKIMVKTKKGLVELKNADLAYLHIRNEKQTECIAIHLGLEARPCTEPFPWKSAKRVK